MTFATIVLTNGRTPSTIEKCWSSMWEHVPNVCRSDLHIVDDSGDELQREYLGCFDSDYVAPVAWNPLGYDFAMRSIWGIAEDYSHVFLIEDDFVFTRYVDVLTMIDMLDEHPNMAQAVLLRQPWFGNEIAHRGVIPALEALGHTFTRGHYEGIPIQSHRATWSTNPTVFRGGSWVLEHPWPYGEGSEYRFGQELFQNEPDTYCAYYDSDTPSVEHIGQRSGFGY